VTKVPIASRVQAYLSVRRAMGFELRGAGYQLLAFARFVEEQPHPDALTMDLLMEWVQGADRPGPATAARRVEVLRPFLRYYRQFEPQCPVIPAGHCGPGHRRLCPHIYTELEIAEMLAAARELKPVGLRPLTYVTLFGLLAVTGLRLSEALRLARQDVDVDDRLLCVRESKFRKSRMVPIHATTAQALAEYARATVRTSHQHAAEVLFITEKGQPLTKSSVDHTFSGLRRSLGWQARGGHPQPRIHDLRHTFICNALLRGQQERSLDHVANVIATYVGHAKVSDTYWYVSATSSLMNEASSRFACFSTGEER